MTIKFTIIALFFYPALVTAQAFQIDKPALPIDSLKKALPLLHERQRIDCLNELARSYNEEMEPHLSDSAMATVALAYKEATAINYIKGIGDACLQYALIYYWRPSVAGAGDIDYQGQSEKYYRQAISSYEKIQDDNGLGYAYRGLGLIFSSNNPAGAYNAFDQSMRYFKNAGNQVMIAELVDCMGEAYHMKGDREKHFENIRKGLELKKQLNDHRGMTFSYYRLGLIYQFVGDMETALDYYHKGLHLATEQSVKWNELFMHIGSTFMWTNRLDSANYYFSRLLSINPDNPRAQAAFGQLCMRQNNYTKAMKYLHPALAYFKKTNDWQMPWACIDLAKCYAGLKQYATALRYGRECSAAFSGTNVMEYVYEMYSNIYEDLKQKDSANFYFRKYVTIRDSLKESLSQRQQSQKLAMFKITAREEQQQAHINLLNKDNQIKQQQLQKEALQKKILIGGLAAFILLGIIVLRNITLKRKNEKAPAGTG